MIKLEKLGLLFGFIVGISLSFTEGHAFVDDAYSTPLIPLNQDSIVVIAHNIPAIFEDKIQSDHHKLWDRLRIRMNKPILINFFPMKRAMRQFDVNRKSCLYLATLEKNYYKSKFWTNPTELLFSDPINQIFLKIYSARGVLKINSLEELNGETVIVRQSMIDHLNSDVLSLKKVKLMGVSSHKQTIEMLDKNRAEYGLVYGSDANKIFSDLNIVPLEATDDELLHSFYNGLVCHKTEGNRVLIDHLNSLMAELRKTGELKDIFN